jgi:hypothetical protein
VTQAGVATTMGSRRGLLEAVPATVVVAVLYAVFVRGLPVVTAGFPLGDGGLFSAMATEIRGNQFLLPAFTAYNGGGIPFAYPPVGLYVLAVIPGDPIFTERWLPLLISLATIPVGWRIATQLIGDRRASIAAFLFALTPAAYQWLILGGGVTRGVAMLFSMLAALALLERRPVWVMVAGGAAVLAHPEAMVQLPVALLIVWWFLRRSRSLLLAIGGSLLPGAAWYAWVAWRHGLPTVMDAFTSRSQSATIEFALWRLLHPSLAEALDVVGVFALIGAAVLISRRHWLLPAWALALIALPGDGSRAAALPIATMAAVAVPRSRPAQAAVIAGATIAALFTYTGTQSPVHVLSADDRAAMAWVAANTPVDSTFLVAEERVFPEGLVAEWFPALTGRRSLTTPQGQEWTPEFNAYVARQLQVAGCTSRDCLPSADYIFVSHGCCQALIASLGPPVAPGVYRLAP